jgi:hypothetical protein
MTASTPNYTDYRLIMRRSILLDAAASLLCAPTIVRATSLMPVRSLLIPNGTSIGPQFAGFWERLFYHSLDCNLKTGRMSTNIDGRIIPEAEARRLVGRARAQGWLPPGAIGYSPPR